MRQKLELKLSNANTVNEGIKQVRLFVFIYIDAPLNLKKMKVSIKN